MAVKTNGKYTRSKSHLLSKTAAPCLICKKMTCIIDICSEAHICSKDCQATLDRMVTEKESL